MADVITFSCPQCEMPYRVAVANAGRNFVCKNCNTSVRVPDQNRPSAPVIMPAAEPEVLMDQGAQVIRKTDSARRASVDPTRMITRNSGRLLGATATPAGTAPSAPAAAPKSKMPLIVAAAVVVALVAGLGIAAALGAFSGPPATGPAVADNTHGNSPGGQPKAEPTEREKILAESASPARTGPGLIKLYTRAVDAKLGALDVAAIARDAVDRIHSENGQDLDDNTILDFGEQLQAREMGGEAQRLYLFVARRHKDKTDTPPSLARAQKLRKLEKVDFAALLALADEVVLSGLAEGADTLRTELAKLQQESDNGWATSLAVARAGEIESELKKHQAEIERISREEPFRVVAASAIRQFKAQKAATRSSWGIEVHEPLIIYYERGKNETDTTARNRCWPAIQGLNQFIEFFRTEWVQPMGLARSLPTDLEGTERESAPVEILLFEERQNWRAYLSDNRITGVDSTRESMHIDQPRGRLTTLLDEGEVGVVGLMTTMTAYCIEVWHPRAKETRKLPSFKTYAVETILSAAMSLCLRTPNGNDIDFTFYYPDRRWVRILHKWRQPFAVDAAGSIDSFGGPGLRLKDIVSLKDTSDFTDRFMANVKKYTGWTKAQYDGVEQGLRDPGGRLLGQIMVPYLRAFAMFLWHFEKDGKPRYRDAFRRFLLLDLQGKVTADNQLEKFTEAFGLDDAGWKAIEQEFEDYQSP